jgi:hypothetical protein
MWPILPRTLTDALAAGGDEANRVFAAMMPMQKIDIATIEKAQRASREPGRFSDEFRGGRVGGKQRMAIGQAGDPRYAGGRSRRIRPTATSRCGIWWSISGGSRAIPRSALCGATSDASFSRISAP